MLIIKQMTKLRNPGKIKSEILRQDLHFYSLVEKSNHNFVNDVINKVMILKILF